MPVPTLSWLNLSDFRPHRGNELFTFYRQTPISFPIYWVLCILRSNTSTNLGEMPLKRNLQGHSIPEPNKLQSTYTQKWGQNTGRRA